MNSQAAPRVFVSYRQECKEHSEAVSELCCRLRSCGIDCRYDQEIVWPEEGWLVWMRRQIVEARFILAICSPQYRQQWEAIRPAVANEQGKGTGFEASLLAQEIYEAHGLNKRIIPVVLNKDHANDVPLELRKYMVFDASSKEQFDRLYGLLTGQLKPILGPLGEIKHLPSSPIVRRTFGGLPIGDNEAFDPMALRKRIAASVHVEPAATRELTANEVQKLSEAAGVGDGPMIVSYTPGSGKTLLIVRRVISLVESGVTPAQILILTATDDDGREISYRLEHSLPGMFKGMTCGTFSEAALAALRHEAQYLGRSRDFSVIDKAEATAVIAKLMGDAAPALAARLIHSIYSCSAHTLLPIEVVLMDRFPWLFWAKDTIRAILGRYEHEKADCNVVDEENLIAGWNRLLAERPDILGSQRAVWRHLIVDRFHEVTRLQSLIVHQLVGEKGGNLLVLVNEWQAICSARGCCLANVRALPRLYPTAARFSLETNYRSTPEIVELVNRILARDHSLSGTTKLRAARCERGSKPKLVVLGDPVAQAAWVCEEIKRLQAGGRALRDIAVLYRSRASSLEADIELSRHGIPVVSLAQPPVLEQDHIQDVLASLRAADDAKDQAAWLRILRLLPGISQWTAKSLWNRVARNDESSIESTLAADAAKSWSVLQRSLAAVRIAATPTEKLRCLLETDLGSFLQSAFDDYEECVADILRLSVYAQNFSTTDDLLKHVERRHPVLTTREFKAEEPDAMWLAAIADVRDLEFDTVFILGLTRGEFPSTASFAGPREEDEERRAFFVAATRARDQLYMLCPGHASELSPFLEELHGAHELVEAYRPDLFSS